MLFAGSLFYLNITIVFSAYILSWYFGSVRFSLHPDKFIASIISYNEKLFYRTGSYKEGFFALKLSLLAVFILTALLLYFSYKAGSGWYYIFGTAITYLCIDKSFTDAKSDQSNAKRYLNYAIPVLLYSLVAGPLGAVSYRTLAIFSSLIPITDEKYKVFSKAAETGYETTRDAALILIPVIFFITDTLKSFVRFLKSIRS
jgi:cobalamin biosynthesis protein CobD/CbiB